MGNEVGKNSQDEPKLPRSNSLSKIQEFEKQFANVPYTSYSSVIGKRSSQKLEDEIVTVIAKPQNFKELEPEIERLQKIPTFIPLIPNSVDPKGTYPKIKIDRDPLNVIPQMNLCSQLHWLFYSAKGEVENLQISIKVKINSSQEKSLTALKKFTKFAFTIKSFEERVQEIKAVEKTITNINQTLVHLTQQLQRLYALLPEEERDSSVTPLHFAKLKQTLNSNNQIPTNESHEISDQLNTENQ